MSYQLLKSDLQPYGAPDGTAVFVLIVKLQMRNQQLEHSTGVTGGQTVQFTLEKRRETITGAATENIRDYSDQTTRCCVPAVYLEDPVWRFGRPPWATPHTALVRPPQSMITDDQQPTGAQES